MFSQTMAALEKFDNQHDFERMSADILNALGYRDVALIAPRGGSDGGKDITFTTSSGKRGLACVTLRKDIEKKFQEDFFQRQANEFDLYMLFCNAYLTAQQKQKFENYCVNTLRADFIPQDIEALRSLLDSSLVLVRKTYIDKYLPSNLDSTLQNTEHETLYDLLPLCTVKITIAGGGVSGTGFFVAPELILTTTDVITRLSSLTNENDRRSIYERTAIVQWGKNGYAGRFLPLTPKLVDARLGLVELHIGGHPCVLLQENSRPSDVLYTYGYSERYLSGASATFECEGKTMLHRMVLKLKGGLISPSMYGSPLLNLRTGGVCGVICYAQDEGKTDGGLAVLTSTIFECLPDLRAMQQDYHKRDRKWDDCLIYTSLRS